MSVFAGGRRVNLNIFAVCIICYIVASSSVETPSRRFVFAGNSFSDLSRIQAHRLNNILITGPLPFTGHLRDTDIRQCIHNHTNFIYCAN